MNRIQQKRMLKLADFLDTLEKRQFIMSEIARAAEPEHTCGSRCCALGWLPKVFPRTFVWIPMDDCENGTDLDVTLLNECIRPEDSWGAVGKFFGINRREVSSLFVDQGQEDLGLPNIDDESTPQDMAAVLREFVKTRAHEPDFSGFDNPKARITGNYLMP